MSYGQYGQVSTTDNDDDLIINVDDASALDQLQFQDFSHAAGATTTPFRPAATNVDYTFEGDGGKIQSAAADSSPYGPALWTIAYYAQFFDVDAKDVLNRITMAVLPFKNNFLDKTAANPDLYGPFWVTTTLIFAMGMTGNLATYMSSEEGTWVYDFTKLTFAATMMYNYVTLFPLMIWAFLKFWVKADIKLLEIICLFGYSVFIFIPVSIVCIIPNEIVRWISIMAGVALTTMVLLANLFPFIKSLQRKTAYIVLGVVVAAQILLAVLFKFYLFNY